MKIDEKERYYQESLRGEHGDDCKYFAKLITEGIWGEFPDPDEAKIFLMESIKLNLCPNMVYVDNEGVYVNSEERGDSYIEFTRKEYVDTTNLPTSM